MAQRSASASYLDRYRYELGTCNCGNQFAASPHSGFLAVFDETGVQRLNTPNDLDKRFQPAPLSNEVLLKVKAFVSCADENNSLLFPQEAKSMDRPAATYHAVASSIEGFVQQVAVSYLSNGYFFFVQGWVPDGKDPKAVDEKLLEKYGIAISKWSRARRKQAGLSNMQYIRFGRMFLLMATHGKHRFFEEEKGTIKDARRTPIRAFGYAISHRGGHSHVRIDLNEYRRLKAHFLDLAVRRSKASLESEFLAVRFLPYAPVRRQFINIWRAVDALRKEAGFELIDISCIRMKRNIVHPFKI